MPASLTYGLNWFNPAGGFYFPTLQLTSEVCVLRMLEALNYVISTAQPKGLPRIITKTSPSAQAVQAANYAAVMLDRHYFHQ